MIVVSDTGPIRYLLQIRREGLLSSLFDAILIPHVVLSELGHAQAPESVRMWTQRLPSWIEVRSPSRPLPEVDIDPGEAAALALTLEKGCDLLTDDRLAVRAARKVGVEAFGTLGILQQGHVRHLIDIGDALADLGRTNFRHTPELFQRVADEARRMRDSEV